MTRDEALAQLTAPGQPCELVEVEMFGRRCRAFMGAPPTLRDLYAATRSDKPFFVYEDERYSFEDIWRQSCRLARALTDQFGVRKGDRVAISLRNYPEWVVAFNAATSIGAIAVALNALWQPSEMEFAVGDCGPKVLVADQERLDRLGGFSKPPTDLTVLAVRPSRRLEFGLVRLHRRSRPRRHRRHAVS